MTSSAGTLSEAEQAEALAAGRQDQFSDIIQQALGELHDFAVGRSTT